MTAGGAAQVMMGAVDREMFLKPTLEQVRAHSGVNLSRDQFDSKEEFL